MHDGLLARNPCSRRTSPPAGRPRGFVATTAQVWALHDAVPERLRPAILLGAFAGLRVAEAVALRTTDVDWLRCVITPAVQGAGEPAEDRGQPDAAADPAGAGRRAVRRGGPLRGENVVTNGAGRPITAWTVDRVIRQARPTVAGLPGDYRFHDLRHFYASLLIAAGLDVKTVQQRLRHGSAKTTLDTYGHLWPDRDEATRAVVGAVLAERSLRPAERRLSADWRPPR